MFLLGQRVTFTELIVDAFNDFPVGEIDGQIVAIDDDFLDPMNTEHIRYYEQHYVPGAAYNILVQLDRSIDITDIHGNLVLVEPDEIESIGPPKYRLETDYFDSLEEAVAFTQTLDRQSRVVKCD